MALCGVAFVPPPDGIGLFRSRRAELRGVSPLRRRRPEGSSGWRAGCSLRRTTEAGASRRGGEKVEAEGGEENEVAGPATKFEVSDFAVADRVSVGLHGRSDEVIYEATVCDPNSPLYNSRVVLRQLTSTRARRRGRRALEVLKKLARRQIMYHSYSMQVHGYISASDDVEEVPFTLVHGYHGSYSLRHWLQLSDWFPALEATLALDEEYVRRIGDDTTGGPTVTRQLRLTRILMRDLLIGVNYLHSHGLAHTELRLENVHISPVDKHVKVGILGNAVDFHDSNIQRNAERRKLMIAYDMRCIGFIMAKVIMKELMDASTFRKFKSFLTKGNDPTCLREFLLPILCRDSPSGNIGLQMLDRNWGAGWNLLSLLLATKPSERISSLDALRHPFLCGPKWRVQPSMGLIRWGLGSTVVRIAEDYIYDRRQRSRMVYFIELMELLNPSHKLEEWQQFLSGRWRLLYSTGRHIGITFRQPASRVLISNAYLTFKQDPDSDHTFTLTSDITFKVMTNATWPHDKSGSPGSLNIKTVVKLCSGRRFYPKEDDEAEDIRYRLSSDQRLSTKTWKQMGQVKELPSSLPAVKFIMDEIEVSLSLDDSSSVDVAKRVVREVQTQIPPEMFDVSKLICGTYVDPRMMVLRGVSGSALIFTRSCTVENCT